MASLELEAPFENSVPLQKYATVISEIENDSSTSSFSSKPDAVENDEWYYPHPTDFKLSEKPIDEVRELKVAVIGAGLTGITSGILLSAKVPGINLSIFEKNADVVSYSTWAC